VLDAVRRGGASPRPSHPAAERWLQKREATAAQASARQQRRDARGVPPVLDAVRRRGGVQAHDQQEWALHQSWPTNTHKCLLGWC